MKWILLAMAISADGSVSTQTYYPARSEDVCEEIAAALENAFGAAGYEETWSVCIPEWAWPMVTDWEQ